MPPRRTAYLVALGASMVVATSSAARAEPRAVIELFTSQGCSSCPPADKLLGQLSTDPTLVTISLPVDYWDYLGWKDTLGDARHSARQRAYARARGDRQVYTPQVVINGAAHVIGSDKAEIDRALPSAGAAALPAQVRLSIAGSNLSVEVAGNESVGTGEVWIYGVAKAVAVAVGRGENRGRIVTYHNVARRWLKLGNWTGKPASWNVPLSQISSEGVDKAVVLVQRGTADSPAAMLGAAAADLR